MEDKTLKCGNLVRKNFHILDKSFIVLLLMNGFIFGFSIWNMILIELKPSSNFYFTNIFPPYTGIASGVAFIIIGISLVASKKLKKNICGNNGIRFTLLG